MASSSVYSYPTAYATSGSIKGTNYKNAIGKGSNTSAVSGNDYCSSNGSTAYISYSFEFDGIPANATIDSVTCTVKGHLENTSRSTANLRLYSGTTAKGSQSKFTSTSAQTVTLTTGTWTRSEIDNMTLRFTIGYYGGLVNGATVTVNYSWNDVHYTVTISGENVDPSGSVEVSEGSDFTIKAYHETKPTVTDNGVDVTSQVVQVEDTAESYSVENITTQYEFELNSSGYYESNNQGVANSAAVAKVNFHVPVEATITFSLINYAESTYDFGLLSEIDKTLSTNHSADNSNVYWSGENNNSSSVQTVTYTMQPGDHYIYVKFFKDTYTDDNNDSLQFKVAITLNEEFTPGSHWEYNLTNVTATHTIVVTAAGTKAKLYFKTNGSWVESAYTKIYKKVNGSWVEQTNPATAFDTNTNYVKG